MVELKFKSRKFCVIIAAAIVLAAFLSASALAVSESEVQAQVDANGREAVAGNVFIWFLCAVAFLKISENRQLYVEPWD